MFNLRGTYGQNALIQQAMDRCDFDFRKMAPSLLREGKQSINVEWADLSRYTASDGKGHDHVHDGSAVAHTIERRVDGRMRVLGLFYLPPHTKIVLDISLANHPLLAIEVFLAEVAHAVDYHFMTNEMRRQFVNSLHTQQLPPDANCADGVPFHLDGHTCSWFDVNSYAMWVGEAFMEGFIEATSDVKVTINLGHPVGPEDRSVIRQFLGIDPAPAPEPEPQPEVTPESEPEPEVEPAPEPEPAEEEPQAPSPTSGVEGALVKALERFIRTKGDPAYLRKAAEAWLNSR